jgi:hypothetical protein
MYAQVQVVITDGDGNVIAGTLTEEKICGWEDLVRLQFNGDVQAAAQYLTEFSARDVQGLIYTALENAD